MILTQPEYFVLVQNNLDYLWTIQNNLDYPKQFGLSKTIWTIQNHFGPKEGQGMRQVQDS